MRKKGKSWRGEQLRNRLDQYSLQKENDKWADKSRDFKAKESGAYSQEGSSLEGAPWVKGLQRLPGVLQKEKKQGRIGDFPVACAICIRLKPSPRLQIDVQVNKDRESTDPAVSWRDKVSAERHVDLITRAQRVADGQT